MENPLRNLPSVNQLLDNPALKTLVESANRTVVVSGVRSFLDQMRDQISDRTQLDSHVQRHAEKT